jgi:hypothetical protein
MSTNDKYRIRVYSSDYSSSFVWKKSSIPYDLIGACLEVKLLVKLGFRARHQRIR